MTVNEKQDIISGLQSILDENGEAILSSPDALYQKLGALNKISVMVKRQLKNAAELGILTRFCGAKKADLAAIQEKAIIELCEEYGTAKDIAEEIISVVQTLTFKSATTETMELTEAEYESEQWKIAEAFREIYNLKGREIYKERDLFLSMFKDFYPDFSPKVCRLIKVAIDCGAFSMVLGIAGNDDAICESAVRKMADDYGIAETFAVDIVKSIAWSIGKNPGFRAIEKKQISLPEKKEESKQDVTEQYRRGEALYKLKAYAEALEVLQPLAENGNADAGNLVGACCEELRDYAGAVKWYQKAAEQGNAKAQFNLGYAYEHGRCVEQNDEEAVKWYRKAAEQGDVDGQYELGYCLKYGYGVSQNITEAKKWLRKAADQGNKGAIRELAQ